MGLFFRKSVKIGPVRLNASKNGIGYSIGGKLFRYTKSANGREHISGGMHGIYYRQSLSSKKRTSSSQFVTANQNNDWSTLLAIPFILVILSPILGLIYWDFYFFLFVAAIGLSVGAIEMFIVYLYDKSKQEELRIKQEEIKRKEQEIITHLERSYIGDDDTLLYFKWLDDEKYAVLRYLESGVEVKHLDHGFKVAKGDWIKAETAYLLSKL